MLSLYINNVPGINNIVNSTGNRITLNLSQSID